MSDFLSMAKSISSMIESVKMPSPTIPSVILALSTIKRPGLSAIDIASNIIRRQSEAGAPYGPAEDGTQNVSEAMERIRIEEIVKALRLDSRIQVSIPIGGIQIFGVGANSGGPVTITGFNTNFVHGDGVIN